MSDKIRVILPKKYDLVIGDTFQLFYRGVIEAPNPYVYSIVTVCEKGQSFPRYFEYTPQAAGAHKLSISVYDAQRNLLGHGETILNVVKPKMPEKCTNILVVGDSLTASCQWIKEVDRRIASEDGTPCGLGFKNAVNFVGTNRVENVACEAYGGWHWASFLTNTAGAMWIECKNNRSVEDQHSIWQDINGALWQLETLQIDYLKFNRYKDHTSPKPEHGPLIHVKNAVDTNPINFTHSSTERATPFYDNEKGEIDFQTYAKRNNIESIDAVYVFLGTNGLMSAAAMTHSRPEYCQLVVNTAKKLVAKIKAAFPNVLVKIIGLPQSSCNGGVGANYGAELPLTDAYEIAYYKNELDLAYQAWCLEEECKDYMEFINLSGQFDCEYAYPSKEKPVNVRSNITERMDTNAVHPTLVGYMQIADAIYRNIVNNFCSE